MDTLCEVGDLSLFDRKVVFYGPVELVLVKRSRVMRRFSPDTFAAEVPGEQADGLKNLNANRFNANYFPADVRMNKQKIDHQVMAPSASDHRGPQNAGEPFSGDFEVKAEFALRFICNHAFQFRKAGRCRLGVAVMTPSFGSQPGKFTSICCTSLHGWVAAQFGGNTPLLRSLYVLVARKAQQYTRRSVITYDGKLQRDEAGYGRSRWSS